VPRTRDTIHENHPVVDLFEYLYDYCLVRTLEISLSRSPEGHRGELADRLLRILLPMAANRIGYGEFTAYQLKVIQECVTLTVFVVFAWIYLGEDLRWNYMVSFLFLVGAVFFAFCGKVF
jgi:Putative member of DMT superfamily (DUF486)